MRTHAVIPDMQVTPDSPRGHLPWIGEFLLEKRPEVVVILGDWWDMNSLSKWNSKLKAEATRYLADVNAGNAALAEMMAPIETYNARQAGQKNHGRMYRPEMHFIMGNHEHRITRYVEDHPEVEGWMGLGDLDTRGFQRHDFLELVTIDGITYSHYFETGNGRAMGGSAESMLKQLGFPFVQGHRQGLLVATRGVLGRQQWGIVAGSAYLHDEDYMQRNDYWRGIVMLHEVEDGASNPAFIDLGYLGRRYGDRSSDGTQRLFTLDNNGDVT